MRNLHYYSVTHSPLASRIAALKYAWRLRQFQAWKRYAQHAYTLQHYASWSRRQIPAVSALIAGEYLHQPTSARCLADSSRSIRFRRTHINYASIHELLHGLLCSRAICLVMRTRFRFHGAYIRGLTVSRCMIKYPLPPIPNIPKGRRRAAGTACMPVVDAIHIYVRTTLPSIDRRTDR